MAGAVYLVGRIIQEYVVTDESNLTGSQTNIFYVILTLLFCLVMNAWGLVMTGMEHSLHIFFSLFVIWSLLLILNNESRSDFFLVAALILLPLIRFEGIAQSILTVLALFYLRHSSSGIIAIALLVLVLLSWYAFTYALGLPLLPSSVQLKSDIAASVTEGTGFTTFLHAVLMNLKRSLTTPQGMILIFAVIILILLCLATWKKNKSAAVVIGSVSMLAGCAHIFFGHYDWFSRYEIYAISMVVIACIVLGREYLSINIIRIGVILFLSAAAAPSLRNTIRTPLASRNIFQQQYQMHRFVVEYWKRPVAVNDLGWVSYGNSEYVLDLAGLGSEEVRHLIFNGKFKADDIQELVDRKNVQLIIIYDEWFSGVIPSTWIKVATLETSRISTASGLVTFYVSSNVNLQEMHVLLGKFRPTLPVGSKLNIY